MVNTVEAANYVARRGDNQSVETISYDDVTRLVQQARQASMLDPPVSVPEEWKRLTGVPAGDVAAVIRQHLSRSGWHQVLEAMRRPDHHAAERAPRLTDPSDFLSAVESALEHRLTVTGPEPPQRAVKDILAAFPGQGLSHMTGHLQRQIEGLIEALGRPAEFRDWLLSPRALWRHLSGRSLRAQAEAQIETALGEAALYTARMMGTDAERDAALARVDRLRAHLRRQLKVFCEEEGLPLPRPYSREEAYSLHLLTAYFVSLAEAERAIAKRGSALARRQIALEGERTEAHINSQLLPELLDALYKTDPLREGFLRERVRHRSALIVSGVVAGIGGSLWGLLEGGLDVLVAGLSRYAPIVAPPLLVGIATLVALTVTYGPPLGPELLVDFMLRALWNTLLTLGVTATIYGGWHYYVAGSPRRVGRRRIRAEGPMNEEHAAESPSPQRSSTVGPVSGSRPGDSRPIDRAGHTRVQP